jgi:hypothetical protein
MTQEKTLNELLAENAYLDDLIKQTAHERQCLPRNDKENAHKLLLEINKLTKEKRELKPAIARVRELEEKRENHSLWCSCIRELYGEEDLSLCFEWIKQERKRRKETQCKPNK